MKWFDVFAGTWLPEPAAAKNVKSYEAAWYTMLLPAAGLKRGFPPQAPCKTVRWKTQVTKEGWAEMLPIYLAMLDGDEEKSKFESLYFTYRKLMFHVANGILNDEGLAEDAVHQAFLKVLENFDKVGDISCHKTRSYVVIIVRNAAINMYNSRKRHSAVPIEEAAFCIAEEKLERTDDLDSLAEAVLKLPVIYKDALKLKYVQGFSNSEIARMLDISEAAVRKRLERARRMLEEILGREGNSDDD